MITADISTEESISGTNSLHLQHESIKQNDVIGVLEQRIYLVPGRYELSLKAKLNYAVSQGAVGIRFYKNNAKDWDGRSGLDAPDKLPTVSSWIERKKTFSIDNCGNFRDESEGIIFCLDKKPNPNDKPIFSVTFGIITVDQCEIWIDNIRLTQIGA